MNAPKLLAFALATVLAPSLFAGAAGNIPNNPPPPSDTIASLPVITPSIAEQVNAQIESGQIAVPEGFSVNIFATPPVVYSSTAVTATVDGTVYAGLDGNSAQGQWVGLGRIVRLRDLDNDGVADEVKPFVPDLDSVRGLVWYNDRLIVMHAPFISAFYDRDGDGIAEQRETLITGVGRPVAELRVDHGQNGLEVGMDGWIYLALGDEGMRATGKDGRNVISHGGGVVRFRPDGTGLEMWAVGTRNIYGVAVGPLLDAFARDNTNDGGGWDVRMHYFSGLTDHGYPSRYINFGEEIVQPIAEYPGGSGTGALWLDEPGIPAEWNNIPLTADWGQQGMFRHVFTPNGATYDVSNDMFLRAPQPIDADVDGNSTIYYATWKGGGFNWTGPLSNGLLLRVVPNGYTPEPLPNFDQISVAELVALHESPSYKRRIEAQRAVLRRAGSAAQAAPLLEALMSDTSKDLKFRVAALFTYKQLRGAAANPVIGRMIADTSITAWALRALGDDMSATAGIPFEAVTASLRSSDPRVRKEALITLARAGAQQYATVMTPLLADQDDIVSHTAVQALRQLHAVDATLAVVDLADAPPALRSRALMVLQSFHEEPVVNALATRLGRETNVDRRGDLVSTIARLANQEAEWNGDWWGTRPDTTGPYFEPVAWDETERISTALNQVLQQAGPQETVALGREFQRMGVSAGAAVEKFIAFADTEPALIPQITSYFARADSVPANAIPVLVRAINDPTTAADVRAEALRAAVKTDSREAWEAVIPAMQSLGAAGGAGRGGRGGGRGGRGAIAVAPTAADLNPAQQVVVNELIATPTNALLQTVVQARNAVIAASLSDLANAAAVQNSVAELISAELALANGRADAFARVQASAARLNAQQIGAFALAQATATPAAAAGGRGGGGGGRGAAAPTVADRSRIAVADAPSIEQYLQLFVQTAGAMDGQRSQLADTVLLELANRRIGAPGPIQAAMRALDAGWSDPRRRIQIMMAAIDADNAGRANQIVAAMDDADPAVASVARYAVQQLAIDPEQLRARATQPKISSMSVATVLDAVATGGNPIRGGRLLNEVGCLACHTVSADDQPRGPFLGAIADILQRRELAEAILDPNRTISQGFATNAITLTDNSAVAGFVVREGGGNITIRTILGQEQRIPVANIASRVELETSLMPAGLVNDLTVGEFQDMLAYLESLANP